VRASEKPIAMPIESDTRVPAAGPYQPPPIPVPAVMRRVMYALLPAALCHTWFFGWGLAINFVICALAAVAAEAIILRMRHAPVAISIGDGSAILTAALIAFSIPPLVPWWIPATGGAFAIVFAKQLYGGLGRNLFNPAMAGYAMLLVSFPIEMTQWLPPAMGDIDYLRPGLGAQLIYSLTASLPGDLAVDALTRATPLDQLREGLRAAQSIDEIRAGSLFGDFGGRGWEWIGNFLILGGLFLLYTRIIRWHIPVAVLAGLLLPATLFHLGDPAQHASPGLHLFSGATLLGAFFIATDPVTAAASRSGRLIYGFGIGLLTYSIRTWGGYPDGVAFAVLLMNAAVPLIDRFTRPRVFGHE